MAPLLDPPLIVAHRFVESEAGLAYYAKRPGGVMWRRRELFDAPVFYLAFHGRPGGVALAARAHRRRARCAKRSPATAATATWSTSPRCNVLRGERGRRFARDFLKASGARAVIGYTTPVNWMASLVADMLFLHRFYSDPSPWRNLRRIFGSVLRDYPRARAPRLHAGHGLTEPGG